MSAFSRLFRRILLNSTNILHEFFHSVRMKWNWRKGKREKRAIAWNAFKCGLASLLNQILVVQVFTHSFVCHCMDVLLLLLLRFILTFYALLCSVRLIFFLLVSSFSKHFEFSGESPLFVQMRANFNNINKEILETNAVIAHTQTQRDKCMWMCAGGRYITFRS